MAHLDTYLSSMRAVDGVDGGAGNCIVIIMDAFFADVAPGQGPGGHGDADNIEPFLAPVKGRNSSLLVCVKRARRACSCTRGSAGAGELSAMHLVTGSHAVVCFSHLFLRARAPTHSVNFRSA